MQGQFIRFLCVAFHLLACGCYEGGLCIGWSGCLSIRINMACIKDAHML